MENLLILILLLFTLALFAQVQYMRGVQRALHYWDKDITTEASNFFERIEYEKINNWLACFKYVKCSSDLFANFKPAGRFLPNCEKYRVREVLKTRWK